MTVMTAADAGAQKLSEQLTGGAGTAVVPESNLQARAEVVAAIAAENASVVDRDARFPAEAISVAKRERLLGIMSPPEFGGEGASVSDVVDVCYRLGQACSATGLIYAMHQVKVACIVKHGRGSAWHERLMRRLCSEQLLLASSTTEGQGGGNVRSSEASIEYHGSQVSLERNATVISYGANADGIVTTARRAADAAPSDQVLAVFLKNDYSLEPSLAWDTLGMRGTCSGGFALKASAGREQILPVPYDKIHAQTMVPAAHLMWSGVWAGIAAGSLMCAQSFLRNAARKSNGELPPGAAHYTRARSTLSTLRGMLASSVRRYEEACDDERVLGSLDFQAMINLTKVEASEMAVAIVMNGLRACGLSGYRNDSPFAIGRHLRDILSSPIMINNDRILSNISSTSLLSGVPMAVRD